MQFSEDSLKKITSKILYYTLFVYLVVPIRRKCHYLDLSLLGGNGVTLIGDFCLELKKRERVVQLAMRRN